MTVEQQQQKDAYANRRIGQVKDRTEKDELHDIDKKAGHPSIAGMKAISDQVHAFVKNHKKANKTKAASRKRDSRNSLPKKANPKRNNKNKAKKDEKR